MKGPNHKGGRGGGGRGRGGRGRGGGGPSSVAKGGGKVGGAKDERRRPRPTTFQKEKKGEEKKKRSFPSSPAESGDGKPMKKRKKDDVSESVRLWNSFREKALDKKTRTAAIGTALNGLSGKLYEASLKHDGARVVQTMIRYGDSSQRETISNELTPKLPDLAKLPYARHVAACLARYCCTSDAAVATFYRALKGKFAKLATHAVGCRAADAICKHMVATSPKGKKSKNKLVAELYGSLGDADSLSAVIALDPERKKRIIAHTAQVARRMIDKSLAHFLLAHEVLNDLCDLADPDTIRDLAAHACDLGGHIASSKPGALALCKMVAFAEAKVRKKLVKGIPKETLCTAAADHKFAYLFLWRACDVFDDTVFIDKQILNEILKSTQVLASSRGGKLCLWLLGDDPTLNTLEQRALDGEKASKKPSEQRRQELAAFATRRLAKLVEKNARSTLGSRPAAAVASRLLLVQQADESFAKALAEAAVSFGASSEETESSSSAAILEDDVGHASLKSLLQAEAASRKNSSFGRAFYELIENDLSVWIDSNRGAFIVDALLAYDEGEAFVAKAKSQLILEKARLSKKSTQGAEALLKRLGARE